MRQLLLRLGSILIIAVAAVSCGNGKDADGSKVVYDGPNIVSRDVFTVFSDSALKVMTLKAKEQIFLQNDDQEYPKGIDVVFLDDNEKVKSTLRADYAYFTQITSIWHVKGNVVVNNLQKQQKLETQEMKWMSKSSDILVEEKDSVTITEPKRILYGKGLNAKDDFSYYKIKHPSGIQFK